MLEENLLWRQQLRDLAAAQPQLQSDLLAACRSSFLFWLNGFVWTFRQKVVNELGVELPLIGPLCHVPFISWPVQDEVAEALLVAVEQGEDVNVEKSRDMGATWLLMAFVDWMFIFRKNVNIGCVSRKEVLVDHRGDMDSLFEKVRYIHRMLPTWMAPPVKDTYMHLLNLANRSSLAGESTNADVGRGGRKALYVVDEAAAIRNADEVEASLSQNTACQIWVSTPRGPMTQFHKRIKEGRGTRLQMPWYRHPDKSFRARQIYGPAGKVRWTSKWYERLPEKYSRKAIAQEVDMDHGQAGDMFFDYTELERHRQDHQAPELFIGDLVPVEQTSAEKQVGYIQQMDHDAFLFIESRNKSPWHFWVKLGSDGRPPQDVSYVFGIDISNGAGASNSVISVMATESQKIVAKFWDSWTSPEQLVLIAARAGIWFGGRNPPALVVWENNGPGGIFGRKLMDMEYPHFYRQKIDDRVRERKGPRYGWHSNPARKEVMLGLYRDGLSTDAIINPCKESLDEAAEYIYDESGTPIPARLREEPQGGRALHGDHAIADGLCFLGASDIVAQKERPIRPPAGSFAYRRDRRKRKLRQQDPWAE